MNRAVITAGSLIAPGATDPEMFWTRVVEGRSAIGRLTRFEACGCLIGGETPHFDLQFIPPEMKPKRLSRHTLLLLQVAKALSGKLPPEGAFGLSVGLATSDAMMIAQSGFQRAVKGPEASNGNIVSQSPPNAAVGAVSQYLGAAGEVHTVSTACAAGLDAIGLAARDIGHGVASCIVAGGGDAPLDVTPLSEFFKSGLASARNDFPEYASRPFDVFADSGVLSDAAGLVLVEDERHARERGATILGEIIGYATNCDRDKNRPGGGYAACMRAALRSAGLSATEIDYISAWGPGHPVLDRVEAQAIAEVFGAYAREIPVSSIKGVLGNPLAAAGPIQVIAALLGLRDELIPPTANLEVPLEIPLNFVRSAPLRYAYSRVLLNAHGIGGTNVTLILQRYVDI